jgi:hypothetical protein
VDGVALRPNRRTELFSLKQDPDIKPLMQISELTAEIKRLNALVALLQKRITFDAAARRHQEELNIQLAIEVRKSGAS